MANTTYPLPLTPAAARADTCRIMQEVFAHAEVWRPMGCIFVSAVVSGSTLNVIFSNPIPLAERQHVRLALV